MQTPEIITVRLHPNQVTVWSSKSRFRVLVAGRRFGKTTLAVNELFKNALQNPGSLNFYIAPTYRQAKMIAWSMLRNLIPDGLVVKDNESDLSIVLSNNSKIELKGADNEDSLRGVGVSFAVIDEYASLTNAHKVWGEVIRPMLTDTKGRALFIGTPKGTNAFFDMFQKGVRKEDGFESWLFKTSDNPYIDREEIEAAKKELPHSMFSQEYECSFITDEERVLITSRILEDLKQYTYLWKDTGKRIISIDPSEGGDACIIYYLNNRRIDDKKIMFERDGMKIVGEAMIMSATHNCDDFVVDAIGVGSSIAYRLQELKKHVIFFKSSETAIIEDKFYNRKAEAWWKVMELIRDKELPYPDDNELRRQLSSVRYKVVESNGKIQLDPKIKTKEILGRSPDEADAFVQGIYASDTNDLHSKNTYDDNLKDKQGHGIPMFVVDSSYDVGLNG